MRKSFTSIISILGLLLIFIVVIAFYFTRNRVSLQEEIYNAGFYLNRDLQFSFNYPTKWILGYKVIDNQGNLNSLDFAFTDPTSSKSSEIESLTVSVTRENGQNYPDIIVNAKKQRNIDLNQEKKKLGALHGDFYSYITEGQIKRYDAIFIATINEIKYGFRLSVPFGKKGEYLAQFEQLISTVQVKDARASSLPEYFRDNQALDRTISQASYLPTEFSITYDTQQIDIQEWNYAMGVRGRSSGPGNLNIDVQRLGVENNQGPRKFIVNLENLLEEKSIYRPGIEKGVARVEPVTVKGLKGYFVSIGNSPENSYGSLIFATDTVVVSIDYANGFGFTNFQKEELLKIAESMVH